MAREVNSIITADLLVTEAFVSRSEADDHYNTKKLPANITGDIQIVKIGDYDVCPCIGPHAKSTGELGEFIIASTEFKDDVLRIRFKLNEIVEAE